ncbi:hypothetical protein AB0P15_20185 [Streptomyces sp. NPDC087917]|uniref:hypothetical protein n=1 Tax=Streptomyces sp. NPDC087917 TaxID=3155060 RepID=UPI00342DA4C4
MTTYRNRTAGAVLAAALLVGGATACESGKKDDGGKAAGAQATPSAPGAGQGAAKGVANATPAAYLEKVQKKSEEITSLRYTAVTTSGGETSNSEVSLRTKPSLAMTMKVSGGDDAAEIRLVDGAMFIGADGQWIKFDMKSADAATQKKLEGSGGDKSAENPGDRAGELLKAEDLKTVGDETVDGVKTKHVSGTVTLEQMRAALTGATPEARTRQDKSVQALEDEGIQKLTIDMWIDESDHTKQVRTRGEAKNGPLESTIKFLDYNQPVDIAAPPADQVMDLAELSKG